MVNIETYKSILQKLSALPTDYLELVDNYLAALSEKIDKKEENRNAIMALAGSWSDMDDDFELSEAWKAEIDRREAEIDRREAEIDSGESVGKPAKEVLAKYKRN